jgi:hypothetical protein
MPRPWSADNGDIVSKFQEVVLIVSKLVALEDIFNIHGLRFSLI